MIRFSSVPTQLLSGVSTLGRGGLLLIVVVGGWASLGAAITTVHAQQATASCTDTLTAAEETYRNRNYQEAVDLASECTDAETVADSTAIRAHRIITLASLRQGALVQARSSITSILQIDSDYTADPVDDPPAYDLFVSMVRQDVTADDSEDTVASEEVPSPEDEPSDASTTPTRPPPDRAGGGLFLKLIGVGLSDYTGDLPIQNAGHPFDLQELRTGSGSPYVFSFELGYQFPTNLALVLGFQAGNYPIIGYSTGNNDISDSWRYTPQLLVRYTFGNPGRSVAVYLDAGGNVTFGGEGIARPGFGPSVGGGVDIPLGDAWSFFVESRFNLTLPDDAIDGTVYPDDALEDGPTPHGSITGPFDSVNQLLGIGLRVRFGGGSEPSSRP